jgi:transcriptional regulator with XRE-family HTH domain
MSDVDSESDAAEKKYAETVGSRLRSVRRQKRLSLQAVEANSKEEFKASVLGAYERGERSISVPRLQRLAQIYDVPLDQLLPAEGPHGSATRSGSRTQPGTKIRIDLLRLKAMSGSEAASLQRFVAKIQLERQDFNGQVLTIRGDDIRVIGATFGLSTDEMVDRLGELGLLTR